MLDAKNQKYLILFGVYVGGWGMLQALTLKMVPIDLSAVGLGVLAFSYGSFVHAITFPCTDAVAEIWGAQRARWMVYVGTAIYIWSNIMLTTAAHIPSMEGWPLAEAYKDLYSGVWRILFGSLVATVTAQLWDIYIFEWLKKLTGSKHLWLRNNLSTMGSQLLDTAIFYLISFYGIIANELLPILILGNYLIKLLIAVVDTPLVYLLVAWIRKSESGEVVEEKESLAVA